MRKLKSLTQTELCEKLPSLFYVALIDRYQCIKEKHESRTGREFKFEDYINTYDDLGDILQDVLEWEGIFGYTSAIYQFFVNFSDFIK